SIKDEQEEKEFWVNIVAAVVIVGVSIVCPPAGLALGIGFGALEASSAISGKDWISGRELSDQERLLRGGFALLDIIPGVKAFSSGTKIASAGSKILRVGDDLLDGGKLAIKNAGKSFKGTIDTGIQAGKESVDSRIISIKNASTGAQKAIKGKLTKDLNDIGEAAKTIQSKAKETFQIPPRERLELAGVGGLSEPTTIAKAFDASKNKLQEVMSKMDNLNIKGSGKDDIIEGVSGAGKLDISTLTPVDIPTVKSGKFEEFFNSLSVEELDEIWKDKSLRKKIERQLRYPGGLHEWHMVSRAPQFKFWDVTAEQIRELRTAISDVKFVNPSGVHGGFGSTTAHNELLAIIDSSTDYQTFLRRLNNWANYRLEGGISSLPVGLRLN
ncbi:pre-toxin TG domain-containing protein, partial [Listeria seeligeri]